MTQHAVGIALSLDPSNVVGLLNELEERELITAAGTPPTAAVTSSSCRPRDPAR